MRRHPSRVRCSTTARVGAPPAGLGAAPAPRLRRGRPVSLLAHQAAEFGERDEVAVLERAREPGRGGGADLLEQADRVGVGGRLRARCCVMPAQTRRVMPAQTRRSPAD